MTRRGVVTAMFGLLLLLAAGSPAAAEIYVVTTNGDAGPGSLRQGILDANSGACASPCSIVFNIPGAPLASGAFEIAPLTPLPFLTASFVTIDGATQTAFSGDTNPLGPEIVINGILSGMTTHGIAIDGDNNKIRNLVLNNFAGAGGSGFAIFISATGSGNVIVGNYIGTNAAGSAPERNYAGIAIWGDNNVVGGSSAADRNVISGSNTHGVNLAGGSANGNQVLGNYMGTDATGMTAISNWTSAVQISHGAANNIIGGPGAGNLIAGNGQTGINIWNAGSGNQIEGNFIGFDAAGGALPNRWGVVVSDTTADIVIGGGTPGAANKIAHNLAQGVAMVGATSRIVVTQNSIFGNGQLGIDLAPGGIVDGPTPNDKDDPDGGANLLQNFPLIASANAATGSISGTLNSTPSTGFTLEFFVNGSCDPSGHGEGQVFVGATAVATDPGGDVAFTFVAPSTLPVGGFITATATGPSGTSEFSACTPVTMPPPPSSADLSVTKGASPLPSVLVRSSVTYSVTVTNNGPDTATNVSITDVPSGGQTLITGGALACAAGGSLPGTCHIGSLPSGASVSFTVQMSPDVLGSISNTVSVSADQPDPVAANNTASASVAVVRPPTFSGSGSATVDGTMDAAEWSSAACQSIFVWVPNAGGPPVAVTPARFCVMNDVANVYFALKFLQSAPEPGNSLVIEFDLDNDGVMDDGDDVFVVNPAQAPMFIDDFRSSTAPGCPPGSMCGFRDIDHGGTNDGQAAFVNDGTFTVYEASHPINSGDPRDMAKCAGDTVGFFMFLRMIGAGAAYPAGFADTDYPGWGLYVSLALTGECASQSVAAGGTVTTDPEADGAGAADPIETTVQTPVAGPVTINEGAAGPPTPGFTILGEQVTITAPMATAADPLVITFVIDQSLLPPGVPASAISIRRNGVIVSDCTAAGATPDPCVQSKTFLVPSGDLEIVVRTSQASVWDVGIAADLNAPSLVVELTPDTLWPPDDSLRAVTAAISVSDDSDPNPKVSLLSIVVVDATGDVSGADPDITGADFGTDDRAFMLRAERSGRGSDRTYVVSYRAVDASGNSRDATAEVRVPHDRRR